MACALITTASILIKMLSALVANRGTNMEITAGVFHRYLLKIVSSLQMGSAKFVQIDTTSIVCGSACWFQIFARTMITTQDNA
jgi:hypothetical protein